MENSPHQQQQKGGKNGLMIDDTRKWRTSKFRLKMSKIGGEI